MGKRCICEICTCGRHHCPHRPWRPGGDYGPCLVTSYNTAYKQHPLQLRESCKPEASALRSDDPLSDKTTFRTDYVKHPLDKPYVHPHEEYKRPPGAIDTLTSYHRDYTEKHAPPAAMIKKEGPRQLPARFEGEPTYKIDYRKWPLEKHQAKVPEGWAPPTQPFEGQSTFTHDFRKYNEPPRKSMRPTEATQLSNSPFDGNTGYRADYIKHPLQTRVPHEKEKYRGPNAPFDGMSTFTRDYTKKEGAKTESCRPNAEAYQSDAPLDDLTTFKNDYRRWNGERPHVHLPEQYRPPEGEMDHNTTHRIQYKPHPPQRVAMMKPGEGRVMIPGEFEGLTNYKSDYKPWGIHREVPKAREGWVPNNIPFEGTATYKSHYTAHNVAPPRSMKPDATAMASNAPFEDATMYRTEYTRKHADLCPAAILDTKSSSYTYVETDTRGHKQYLPVYEKTTPLRRVSSAAPKVPAVMVA
ncbi:stabilizer of axonemal microtubules 2-like [Plakobranchus ocellatus]|uniref:Stabilizer of axonemal microtubules 2-like n=1 Tax=Plakobranchus ocellatus TaxID=259542 RepID=A0AAV3Z1I5_9GAST|nr:stabilizer of axonemal microtubules 2-like [Plakobranchus ocellatus]